MKPVPVDVPEWGGVVYMRPLTGKERDNFELAVTIQGRGGAQVKIENLRARLVVMSACDAEGKNIFTEEDIDALGSRSAGALNRLFAKAQKLSGLTDEDMAELAKNSSNAPNGAATSD